MSRRLEAARISVWSEMNKPKNVPASARDSRSVAGGLLSNRDYVEDLYARWTENPESVEADWNSFFRGFELGLGRGPGIDAETTLAQAEVERMITAFRDLGHFWAQLDPLGNNPTSLGSLELENFGLSEKDLGRVFDASSLAVGSPQLPLRDVLQILKDTYCRTVGAEYRHNQNVQIRRWMELQMEPRRNDPKYSRERQMEILKRLIDAEIFETFLHSRYLGQKRFSLEGAESLIPALDGLIELAPEVGVSSIIMGMAHRGRLNVLANILEKPYALIFSEFEDMDVRSFQGDGDVKYHMGYYCEKKTRNGKDIAISLASNPSHLEAVNPIVEGRVRAKQRRIGDTERREHVLPLLIHGDAAFAGQGLVAETLNLSQLRGYRTGGTVHLIINNQIGFTTAPRDARSTCYPSDVAKMIGAPIFHVNGDDPEAVVYVCELALQFRQEFHEDVVVDLICYRRHGHNETDEPAFTQPLLYKKIKDRPSIRKLYTDHLVQTEVLSEKQAEKIANGFKARLQNAFESAKENPPKDTTLPFDVYWKGLDNPYSHKAVDTGADHESLRQVGRALTTVPGGFEPNPKVARRLPELMESIQKKQHVDWASAELLAFGTLLAEKTPVRLSGQDSARGTFSQRHAVWNDIETQREYVPLDHVTEGQARFCVYNSMLSEAAVLGFDFGYSLGEPHMLVLWEAQFGDFANGAQVIIDQFVVSSQSKWNRTSGLVMLLPHGYEGQGPEHSNAYLERYLAACAEDNIQVCCPTTPAQYFHLLRRQMKRDFRRPLIVMTPKSLLRHPRVSSSADELISGRFLEILDDPSRPRNPRRLVLCTGKIFYDLLEAREERGQDEIALVRLEQLYPFNWNLVRKTLERYSSLDEVVWAQEEPRNRGGWTFIHPILKELFPEKKVCYAGREASASPATGSLRLHRQEQQRLVAEALGAKQLAEASG